MTISQTPNIATLTAGDFEPLLRGEFRLPTQSGELTLELSDVRRRGHALREGGAFSLLFLSPLGPFLPQGTYPLTHKDLGTLEIFLVPIGPVSGRNGYEVVFT